MKTLSRCTLIVLFLTLFLLPATAVAEPAGDISVNGSCTLADAITAANSDTATGGCPAGSGADTITLTGNVNLTSALPSITSEITIAGGGHTIAGNNTFGIFAVTSSGNFTLNHATVSGGQSSHGGAIFNEGVATVTNSTFSNNSSDSEGGAIYNYSGSMTVNFSTFSGNSADYGGGINNNEGTVSVSNSTFSGNSAHLNGGGITNDSGTLTVTNNTFSNNSSDSEGGGIADYYGNVSLINSTFSANSANTGAGLYNEPGSNPGNVTVANSIVAGQTSGGDCYGPINSDGYNIESGTSCGFSGGGDQQNVNAASLSLQALANNGGPTQTMALGAGSVAIDRIPPASCNVSTDQRGVSRPQNSNCDVGAFELEGVSSTATPTDTPMAVSTATPTPTATPTGCWTSLGGEIFEDLNGNGLYDYGQEPGIGNVTVFITGQTFRRIASLPTGWWQVGGLPIGHYVVSVQTPAGYAPTTQMSYEVDIPDRCFHWFYLHFGFERLPTATPTPTFTPTATPTTTPTPTPTPTPSTSMVQGYVWNDLNQEGNKEEGEPGIAEVHVRMEQQSGLAYSLAGMETVTDMDGLYRFEGVEPGAYRVSVESLAGSLATTDTSITVEFGANTIVTQDFGFYVLAYHWYMPVVTAYR